MPTRPLDAPATDAPRNRARSRTPTHVRARVRAKTADHDRSLAGRSVDAREPGGVRKLARSSVTS